MHRVEHDAVSVQMSRDFTGLINSEARNMEKRAQQTLLKQKLGEIKESRVDQTSLQSMPQQIHLGSFKDAVGICPISICPARTKKRTSWMSSFANV